MDFDERINSIKDIQSVTDGYDTSKYLGQKGYFANTIHAFENLDTGTYYGKFVSHLNSDCCFLTDFNNVVGGNPSCKAFRYFLPEELLKSNKKEYKPLTNEEFLDLYDSGKIHSIRKAGKEGYQIRYVITNIYTSGECGVRDIYLNFNGDDFGYGLGYLFKKDFEYFDGIEWKPFRMEK